MINMSSEGEYEFKVDDQAGKLVELKQKLVYFFVTGATAVVVFITKFALDYASRNDTALDKSGTVRWLMGSAFAAMLSAGCALLSIYLGHKSYAKHIKFRYLKLTPDDNEQKKWDRLSNWQEGLLLSSSILLILEIALAFCYLVFLLW
jgi:integral membrane sensor domain MASE1